MLAGRADAADRALEQRVAGEHVAVDEQRRASPRCGPGVCSGRDGQPADRRARRPGLRSPVVPGTRSSAWASTGGVRPALERLAELGDVVVVVMGEQDVGDGQAVLVGLLEQRRERAAGVDEEGVAARPGRDEVGVGQPVRRSWSARRSWAGRYSRERHGAHPHLLPDRRHRPLRRLLRGARLRGAPPDADPRRGDQRLHGPARRRRPARADLQPRRRLLRARHRLQPHRADRRRPRRHAREPRRARASSPRSRRTACARAARGSASCAIRTATGSS